MQFLMSLFVGLLLSISVGAEPLLEGRVRLESGQPAVGVQVRLFDLTNLHQSVGTTTDETGHFTLSLPAAATGSALPQGFALGQNYPNPFNPSTIIPYQIPTAAHVRLAVFNLLGQRIATLVDAERAAGMHTAQWDATDAAGRAVGAGVYIYQLSSDGMKVSRRMVLIDGQAGSPAAGPMPIQASALERVEADAGVYGLTVSGEGLVAYVDPAFRVGVDEVEIVVEEHSGIPRMKRAAGGILGDVNNDGQVDASDALYVLLYIEDNSIVLPNNGDISLGDLNEDGTVDFADAVLFVRYLADPSDPALPTGIGQVSANTGDDTLTVQSLINLTQSKDSASSPAWSPDGRRIAFSGSRGIYVMDADGKNQNQITQGSWDEDPAWSPDGRRIAFSGSRDIYVMDPDGNNLINLTNNRTKSRATYDESPAWSPDGQKIAFQRRNGPRDIYVMDADGRNQTRITYDDNHRQYNESPAWSPDGQKIAFRARRDGSLGRGLFVMDPDGSNLTLLIQESFADDPAWSPNGQKIAFSGSRGIYVMDADGKNQNQITESRDEDPAWSPDGQKIAFVRNNDIYVMAIGGGSSDDHSTPTVTNVAITSRPASGDTYRVGETIEVTVTFSEPVYVTGVPAVSLAHYANGSFTNDMRAHYATGSGSAHLVFRYVVTASDTDLDGVSLAHNPIVLTAGPGSGTVRDNAGNDADRSYLPSRWVRDIAAHKVDGRSPDLVVESPSVSPSSLSAGEQDARITLRATVRNQGTKDVRFATLTWYRSDDATIDATDIVVHISMGFSAAKTIEKSARIAAPEDAGTYYYGACVESVAGESNTDNNCSAAVTVTVEPPDLVVEVLSASPSSLSAGQRFMLRATVRNQGSGDAASTTLNWYRSDDATIDTTDIVFDSHYVGGVGGVDAAQTRQRIADINAPEDAGTYYYGACVESVAGESNTDNNCSAAVTVTVEQNDDGDGGGDDGGGGDSSGSGTTYGVGETLPNFPSGSFTPARLGGGGSISRSGGRTTLSFDNGGFVELQDGTRYTCIASGGCSIENGRVTAGTISVTSGDGADDDGDDESGDGGSDDHPNTRPLATRLAPGSSLAGAIETGGDVDYFKVQVGQAGTLTVYTTGSLDTKGTLEDDAGSTLENDDDGGDGTNFRIERAVTAGTYYVKVEAFSNSHTGSYTIHASVSSSSGGDGDSGDGDSGDDAISISNLRCSVSYLVGNSGLADVTLTGTVRAHRSVVSVRLTGYANGKWVGIDFTSSLSAGESENFSISGIISTSGTSLNCSVAWEATVINNSAELSAGEAESSEQVRVQGSLSPSSPLLNRKQQPQIGQ